jgi:hypothetical protein
VRIRSLLRAIPIFLVETAIMTVFAATSDEDHNRWVEVFVDSTVLTLTVAPLLYWLIVPRCECWPTNARGSWRGPSKFKTPSDSRWPATSSDGARPIQKKRAHC